MRPFPKGEILVHNWFVFRTPWGRIQSKKKKNVENSTLGLWDSVEMNSNFWSNMNMNNYSDYILGQIQIQIII